MNHQHSSKQRERASVSPQHPERSPFCHLLKAKNEKGEHYSTPVKKDHAVDYHTPTKLHDHPPGWDKITWAPKICRKPVRRMEFGDFATAAH